jgi:hypothetical protein
VHIEDVMKLNNYHMVTDLSQIQKSGGARLFSDRNDGSATAKCQVFLHPSTQLEEHYESKQHLISVGARLACGTFGKLPLDQAAASAQASQGSQHMGRGGLACVSGAIWLARRWPRHGLGQARRESSFSAEIRQR